MVDDVGTYVDGFRHVPAATSTTKVFLALPDVISQFCLMGITGIYEG